MLDQLLGSRCLQPNAVFVSAIYSTIYMKNGKVVYQITRESLNVVLLSPSSALFKEFWTFATISENSWTIATFLIVEEAESDQNLTKMNPPEMGCAHFGQLCVNKMLRILPAGWPPAGC